MNIALDIMSGDKPPRSIIKGAINFLNNHKTLNSKVTLYGNKETFNKNSHLFKKIKRIKYIYCKDVISMHDKPSHAFKNKRNSSLIRMIDDLNNKEVDGAISSGNTGVLLTSSLLLLGKLKNIKRPALAPYIPMGEKGFILCDAGANAKIKPIHLLQFGIMTSAYLKIAEKIKSPKIGLLNIGTEKNKGNDLTIEAYPLLKKYLSNFIGNVESRDLFNNKADIILCDGFTGNIVLKLIEGLINKFTTSTLKTLNYSKTTNELKSLIYPILLDIKKTYDYEEYGGTLLLGINGIIMKCHGSSNDKAIENALIKTYNAINNNLISNIENLLSSTDIMVKENNT